MRRTTAPPPRADDVDGQWPPSLSDDCIEVTNPATGEVLDDIPAGSVQDAAVTAARKASAQWSRTAAGERAQALKKAARAGALRAGTVKINSAWGGAPGGAAEPYKASGRGYGDGPELLDEVTITKVVHHEPARTPSAGLSRLRA